MLAIRQHPGIAQVYEAGVAETRFGRQPFFAMEFVAGETLTGHANRRGLSTRARLGSCVPEIRGGDDHRRDNTHRREVGRIIHRRKIAGPGKLKAGSGVSAKKNTGPIETGPV